MNKDNKDNLPAQPKEELNLLALFQQGDRTSLTEIKANHTGSLTYAIINMVKDNKIQQANALLKLLDIVHRYADPTPTASTDDNFTDFLKKHTEKGVKIPDSGVK